MLPEQPPRKPSGPSLLGTLSAKYESGRDGTAAVGYDRVGGTSYGRYQIAVKPGTMDIFLKYLKTEYPDLYQPLAQRKQSYDDKHGLFANEWRNLAKGKQLKDAEHKFIKRSHYDVALQKLHPPARVMVDTSPTVQQVLWSASVQLGAGLAASNFNKLIKSGMHPDVFIVNHYEQRITFFRSSSNNVKNSLRMRFADECVDAIEMLKVEG